MRRGFTLVELMVVISIIGVLSTTATVGVQQSLRYTRDVKRISDAGTIRTGLELFYDTHLSYPIDRVPGGGGLLLGEPETSVLSDLGFASAPGGSVYISSVPADPQKTRHLVYRSLHLDGSDCDAPPCPTYEITFELEEETAGLPKGMIALTPEAVGGAGGRMVRGSLPLVSVSFGRAIAVGVSRTAEIFAATAQRVADNPGVEAAATTVVAPAATAAALANAATLVPLAQAPRLFIYFFSQPFLLLFRKRRRSYGVVYNGLSKVPVDLAIVRLLDLRTNSVVRSAVTDLAGRYQFLAPPGTYRLETVKPGFSFPSSTLRGRQEDGPYVDLYYGEPLIIEANQGVSKSIPVDPVEADLPDASVLRSDLAGRLRHGVALSGVAVTFGTALAAPSTPILILLLAHVLIYLLFRRLSEPVRARGWGTVYDEASGKPVAKAVVRLFSAPYNKLIGSAVADSRGRYHFLIGQTEVYLTVFKPGYLKTETEPVDFSAVKAPTVIVNDLPLRRERPVVAGRGDARASS